LCAGRLRAELEGLKKSALSQRVIEAVGMDRFYECEDSDDPREAAIMLLLELKLGTAGDSARDRRRSSVQPVRQSSEKLTDVQRRASRSSMIYMPSGLISDSDDDELDSEDDALMYACTRARALSLLSFAENVRFATGWLHDDSACFVVFVSMPSQGSP